MGPFKQLLGALSLPWETGWGRALSSNSALPTDILGLDVVNNALDGSRQGCSGRTAFEKAKKRLLESRKEVDISSYEHPPKGGAKTRRKNSSVGGARGLVDG